MKTMDYKGYAARIEFDGRDNIFVGHIAGIDDIIGFHADNVASLRAAFEEAVDDYLEVCAQTGKKPEKSASGKMMLRVHPEVHRAALVAAETAGISLNQWAARVLEEAVHHS